MAVAFVAAITAVSNKVSGTTLAISATTTIGELVVIGFAMDPTAGTVSCADAVLNTYQKDVDIVNGSGTAGVRTVVFSSRHTAALTAQNITVTFPTAIAKAGGGLRFSGVATANWLDQVASHIDTGSSWTSGATPAPTFNDEAVVGVIGIEQLSTTFTTIGTGMTPDQTTTAPMLAGTAGTPAAGNIAVLLMYAIQTVATQQTADYTSSTAGILAASACATYKGLPIYAFPAGYANLAPARTPLMAPLLAG